MGFSERAKTTALAIVKIFETSEPFGNYSAVAVLTDGAGISYGISQFTHKSGSLFAVIQRYYKLGGKLSNHAIETNWEDLKKKTRILACSNNKALRTTLAKLGEDPTMQQAQREIAFENYLKPALEAAEGSNFQYPLSLAVIYDSINQGSYALIRDRVKVDMPGNGSMKPEEFEKEWVTEYVKQRDSWLKGHSKPIVRATAYRTGFFLEQIKKGNWNLNLPMSVHGFQLTKDILKNSTPADAPNAKASIDAPDDPQTPATPSHSPQSGLNSMKLGGSAGIGAVLYAFATDNYYLIVIGLAVLAITLGAWWLSKKQ